MRKVFIVSLLICLSFCLFGCSLDGASLLYSDSAELNGFYVGINKISKCCFVGNYNCTDYTVNSEITIPDDYNGIPIKRIGGYFGNGVPEPFSISLADLYMNAPKDSEYDAIYSGDLNKFEIQKNYFIEDVVFNLNIGKNIEAIALVKMDNYYPHINDDGSITFYHSVVSITCSDENKYFYSKDGKLYDKKTDELIEGFAYAT